MAVPGKADELEHPIELGAKCKAKFEYSLSSIRWKNEYYKAFAYAYDAKGRYTCALSKGEGRAIQSCNETRGSLASPSGINGNDLGGCKIYAKSPVNGKYAIVWKVKQEQAVKNKNTKTQPHTKTNPNTDHTGTDFTVTIIRSNIEYLVYQIKKIEPINCILNSWATTI